MSNIRDWYTKTKLLRPEDFKANWLQSILPTTECDDNSCSSNIDTSEHSSSFVLEKDPITIKEPSPVYDSQRKVSFYLQYRVFINS